MCIEDDWYAENCAEVWSCRQAILRGVKFEDMEMYCLHGHSGQEAPPCRNCKETFKQIIERMKEDKYKPEIDENNLGE